MTRICLWSAGLLLVGCIGEVSRDEIERSEQQPYDDGAVAVAQSALGSVDTIQKMCNGYCYWLGISGDYALSTNNPNTTQLRRAHIENETVQTFDEASGEAIEFLTVGPDGQFYYSVRDTGGGGEIRRFVVPGLREQRADTVGVVSGFTTDPQSIYWTDSRGLMRTGREGACCDQNLLSASQATQLLGRSGTSLYLQRRLSSGRYEVRRYDTATGNNRKLDEAPGMVWGFSQDDTFIYWIDGGPTYRIRRMNKSAYSLTTLRSSTTEIYLSTAAHSGDIWYTQRKLSGDPQFRIMKRQQAPVEITTERSGIYFATALQIHGDYLYWLENASEGAATYLKRAAFD